MRAALPSRNRIHYKLKHRTENGGRNTAPVKARRRKNRVAYIAVARGRPERIFKQSAVYIAKTRQNVIKIFLAIFFRSVKRFKQLCQTRAKIITVITGALLDICGKRARLENAGVLGKKTEFNT